MSSCDVERSDTVKAILVMDMPSGCINCKLYDYPPSRCFVNGKFQNNISEDYKPDWCPLKPAPEKKDENKIYTMTQLYRAQGYNACIDEILGDKE